MDEVDAVEIKVLFFAKSREITGSKEANIKIVPRLLGRDLLENILAEFPKLKILQDNLLLSVNQEYIEKEQLVEVFSGDEVAVIPPISGG
eukprot:Seg6085.1 transcript_id=Seg6085.1/GoldUCD/mRNA.D3Y31 product="hypothetical protein" protein_id=Seg6085.1/GoldUCD/D3Y31